MKLGKIFGSISPAYGLMSGQGLLGSKALAPLFGGLGMALGGRGLGGKDEEEEEQPLPFQGAMQPQPTGMFGAQPPLGQQIDPYQLMLMRQRMFGGGY